MLCHDTLQPFTGGGATLSSLFSSFPRENLFSIHSDVCAPNESRLAGSYRLSGYDLRYLQAIESTRWLIRTVRRLFPSETGGNGQVNEDQSGPTSSRLGLMDVLAHASYFRLKPQVLKAIADFQPELLYAWIGDATWGRTMMNVVRRFRLPYVVHFMDNHIGLKPASGWKGMAKTALFKRQVDRAVAGAAAIFAISDAMAAAYAARWKRRVLTFHGVMPTGCWSKTMPKRVNSVFELAFTGSIEHGQLVGLLDVAQAVEKVNQSGRRARLVLYITDYYRERVARHFASFQNSVVQPHPDADSLAEALLRADALVLAYGFDQLTQDYYRYSFATKLVPYMLSKTPVIAYGPPSIAPIDYVLSGGWAMVVTEQSVELLAESIKRLINDAGERARFGLLAHEAACREHDQTVVAGRFAEALAAVAKSRFTDKAETNR